jgi:hypothetical protein
MYLDGKSCGQALFREFLSTDTLNDFLYYFDNIAFSDHPEWYCDSAFRKNL